MWNKIKDAIFEEDPSAPAPQSDTARQPVNTAGMAAAAASYTPGVNTEFIAVIKKAVFAKQTALTSLVQAAESLAEIIPDQTTRFKAAFKTAGSGRTVQQIAAAADIHLADVEGEELRFKAAVDAKLGGEINLLESTARGAGEGILLQQNLLEELQRKMAEAQAAIGSLTQQQAEATAKAAAKRAELTLTSDQFKAAAQVVRNEITTLRQTVLTTLA